MTEAKWYFNNIRITTIDLKESREIITAKLQPLSEGTSHQTFGNVNPQYILTCYVVGLDDKTSLGLCASYSESQPFTLSGVGICKNFFVEKIDFQWMPTYRQTFRPDKSDTDLVFKATMTLSAFDRTI